MLAEAHTRRARWQHRLNNPWRRLVANCHLNRETEAALEQAGFTLESLARETMRGAFPLVRPSIRGIARKAGPLG